ncbi:MAG: esterase-like activity of phytase family protein, partial [Pseudomonadota bacterium]
MSESPDTRFDDLALTEAERQLAASALVPADLSTVLGDGDDNVLSGGPDSDVIAGFGGDDAISGRAGSDLLAGGFGDDTLRGGPGDDALFGGTGNDDVSGAAGNDLVSGGAGDDTLTGGTGDDSVLGGLGADEIRGGAGDDTLAGGLGRDLLAGGAGDDLVLGGLGDDTLTGAAGDDTLLGGAGDDSLAGGAGDDTLRGGSGEDTLAGGAGDDLLAGDGGSDELRGGAGDDDLRGGAGDDALRGGAGADTLDGGVGADTLLGGGGDDVLNSDGADALRGGGGIDTARFDTEAPVFVDLGAGLVDSIDIAAGPETDLAEPGATPSAVPLGLGVNRVENKVVNGVPPGGAALDEPPTDIDVFTITVPDGAVLTQLILSGFASTDNLGFIAIQEGEALTTDFSAAEPDVSGLIGLANFGVEPFPNADLGDDILPALASGGGLVPPEDFLPFDPEVGLPAGTYTIQVQQLGAASVDYALDFVIEATDGAETGFGTISGVENVIGSAFDDVLIGNGAANALEGAGGDDLIQGDGGDDSVSGDAGDDVLSGGAGDDLVAGGDGDDSVSGDDGDDNLSGDAGNDTLDGGAGADTLSGGDGDDSLVSDGADAIFGGAGTDTADFSGLTEGATGGAFSGVIVDLDVNSAGAAGTESEDGAILNLPPAAGGAQIGDLEVDDVENVIGSDFDDGLFGNNEDNLLAGGAGDDIMHGFDGDDTLDGGDGTDTALFSAAGSGVFADLAAGTAQTVIGGPGFITQQSAQFVGENGFAVRPIVTMGDALPSSGAINPSQDDFDGPGGTYNPIGVMDGIGAIRLNDTTVRVIQNHEVDDDQAFAYKVNVGTENEIELVGSRMSFYDIDIATKTIVDSGIAFDTVFVSELQEDGTLATVIADDIEQLRKDDFAGDPVTAPGGLDGFDRWCSGIMVVGQEDAVNGAIEGTFASGSGVEDTLWFAGEEVDNGNFYTLDPLTGDLYQLPFFGRGSWEGATQVDTGDASTVAFFLSDDDFPVNSLYLYVGEKVPEGEIDPDDPNAFLKKNGLVDGELYVWVPDANLDDDPDNDVTGEDIADAGATMSGQYVKLNNFQPDMAGEPGFDENGFVLQGELRAQAVELGAVFFSRTEDTSTNPEDGTEIVFANTGSPFDGDIEIDPTGGETGGRSIAFTSNTENPPDGPFDNAGGILTQNFDFSAFNAGTGNVKAVTKVIYDGDTDPAVALRSPDNLDWADDGLIYVQEDEAFPFEFGDPADIGPNTNESSIVALNPNVIDANGNAETLRVGQVNRDAAVPVGSFDNDPTDPGEVETSGVVDVSKLFGEAPGTLFLADVQAHTLENGPIREDELTEGSQLFFFGTPDAVATPAIETDTLIDIENITGSAFDDVLLGGAGDNVLSGGAAGDDTLAGRGGDDTLTGGVGDDLLLPGEGIDVADGGEGDDTVSFSDVAIPEDDDFGDGLGIPADVPDDFNNDDDTGVLVDLGAGTATFTVTTGPDTSETSETTLISIENAEGSFDQDTLIGGEGENRLDGLEGDDLLIGSEGDTLIGDDGDDTLQGTATSALLDGGDGDDTADFSGEESGLVIDLSAGTASTDPGIELLGSQEIPTGTEFGGTEIGGLSGLEFIPAFGTYLALSDDQGFDDPSRFYTLALDIDEDGFDAVNFFAVTTLLDFGEGGGFSTFEPGTVDPESIRFDPTSMTAFVTSEADADTLTPPSVREYTLGGIPLDEFGLPEGFAPTEDGTTGVVPNLAFESLTFSPDGAFLFTATEGALTQDGAPATVDAGSPSRIVKYDAATGEPVAQFIYEVEPI